MRHEHESSVMIAKRLQQRQNASVPTTITIRNVPDDTRDELAARAARSGRSLQEYLRGHLIEFADRPDLSTVIDRISARKRTTGSNIDTEQILAWRHADHR